MSKLLNAMKNIFNLFILFSCLCSSQTEYGLPGYRFSNFKETPVWELAKAIQNDDIDEVKELCASKKFNLNFEDPKFGMTVFSLAIANNKRNAFKALIESGLDVNFIFGDGSSNYLLESIWQIENCDSFFLDELLILNCSLKKISYYTEKVNHLVEITPLIESVTIKDDEGDFCIEVSKKLINNGADINEEYFDPSVNRKVSVIEECLIHSNLTLLEYLVIERKISIPKIALIEGEWGDGEVKKLSLTEALNSVHFDPSYRPKLEESRIKILNYLKQTNQE